MVNSALRITEREKNRLKMLGMLLDAGNPYHILDKGFAIVADGSGKRIGSVEEILEGKKIKLMLKDGLVELSVKGLKRV